jgi:hypothetical protein
VSGAGGSDGSGLPSSAELGSLGPVGENQAEALGRIADRALVFQSFLLRRAWGVYYAIWAAAIAAFFVFPALAAVPLLSLSWWGPLIYNAVIVGVFLIAVGGTSWTVGHTYRAISFQDARANRKAGRHRFVLYLVFGLAILIAITAVATLSSFLGLLVLDACLGVLNFQILLTVRRVFPRIPPEGSVALGTYAASVLGSAAVLLVTHNQLWFGLFWVIAIAGWAFSALYALYHAPEEMTVGAGA